MVNGEALRVERWLAQLHRHEPRVGVDGPHLVSDSRHWSRPYGKGEAEEGVRTVAQRHCLASAISINLRSSGTHGICRLIKAVTTYTSPAFVPSTHVDRDHPPYNQYYIIHVCIQTWPYHLYRFLSPVPSYKEVRAYTSPASIP